MNKKLWLLLVLLLAGCTPAQFVLTETITPTRPVETGTPVPLSPTPRLTSTATPPPAQTIQYKCQPLLPELPPNINLTGTMVFDGYPPFFFDLASGKRQDLGTTEQGIVGLTISPDGNHLAYIQFPRDDLQAAGILVVKSVGKQQKIKIPLQKNWRDGDWLDNNQLVFNIFHDPGIVPPVVVFNPFTGQHQELPADYEGLKPFGGAGGAPYHFVSSSMVYDPSLNLVVYVQTTEKRELYTVVWDREAQKPFGKVKYAEGSSPLWSPDRKAFYLAGITTESTNRNEIDDWFRIGANGQPQQLTHFGDTLNAAYIQGARLSPNGRYLAFWLQSWLGLQEQLAVLDLETQKVTAYCLPKVLQQYASDPVWSRDSRYIATGAIRLDNSYPTILFDIQDGWVAQITKDAIPIGWLEEP